VVDGVEVDDVVEVVVVADGPDVVVDTQAVVVVSAEAGTAPAPNAPIKPTANTVAPNCPVRLSSRFSILLAHSSRSP
jgi:hypothetical protein